MFHCITFYIMYCIVYYCNASKFKFYFRYNVLCTCLSIILLYCIVLYFIVLYCSRKRALSEPMPISTVRWTCGCIKLSPVLQPARDGDASWLANCNLRLLSRPEMGLSPVFWEGHPRDPRRWMAAVLALAGDIETNPGPQTNKQKQTHIWYRQHQLHVPCLH